MRRAGLSIAVALLLLPVVVIAAASGALGLSLGSASQAAITDIPAQYLTFYQEAGAAYGIPWQVIAGIGTVECDNGQDTDPACWQEGATNSAGAGGPMQFLAATFAEYGVTPSGTGAPDRWNPADAVYSAANYLKASGAPGDIPDAVFQYNHSWAYVNQVLAWASLYGYATTADGTTTSGLGASDGAAAAAQSAVAYALAQVGTPYGWGDEDPGVAFDCSGLTQAAYAAAGITIPRTAQEQYDASPAIPVGQPLQPGDLVFFGDGPSAVDHVGLVVSGTGDLMVDAPYTGVDVRVESFVGWDDYVGATDPALGGSAG